MSKLIATLAIVGAFLALAAHQAGRLAFPDWVRVVPIAQQTAVDKDAANYASQFKQIHLQAEKDILAHKYTGATASKDLHDWLTSACEKARQDAFAGVSKPLADALTDSNGKPVAFDETKVAAACHQIASQ